MPFLASAYQDKVEEWDTYKDVWYFIITSFKKCYFAHRKKAKLTTCYKKIILLCIFRGILTCIYRISNAKALTSVYSQPNDCKNHLLILLHSG